MKLYEIKEAIENGIVIDENGNVVNPTTGELLTREEFEQLGADLNDGIENLCCWIKDLKAEAKAIKEEEDNLKARRDAATKKAESLTKYVAFLLEGSKFKTPKCSVSYRNNPPSCVISVEASELPEQFQNITIAPKKKEMAEYIKAGNEIKGVELVSTTSTIVK